MSGQPQPLIGHDAITERFKSLDDLTMPVLFLGPEGVGKRTFALWLASGVNSAMLKFLEQPRLSEIRDLARWSVVKGFGKWKVLIIDLSSASTEVQNALLKLLEEPPSFLKIILISSNEFVLSTIKSRCSIVRFYPLSADALKRIYMRLGYDEVEAAQMIVFADGSVSRGLLFKEFGELQLEVDSLFDVPPAKAAKFILNMRDTRYMSLFVSSAAVRKQLRLTHLVLGSRFAGVRGKLLLSTMFLKRSD